VRHALELHMTSANYQVKIWLQIESGHQVQNSNSSYINQNQNQNQNEYAAIILKTTIKPTRGAGAVDDM